MTRKTLELAIWFGFSVFEAMHNDGKSAIDLRHKKRFRMLYDQLKAEKGDKIVFLTEREAKVLSFCCDEANEGGEMDEAYFNKREREAYKTALRKIQIAAGQKR